MSVDEMLNEALICLDRAARVCDTLEAVLLRDRASKLIRLTDFYCSEVPSILGDQPTLCASSD